MKRKDENRKKWSAAILLIVTFFSSSIFAKYPGGTGEPNNPYQIANVADLMTLANDANDYNKCFIMTADIDLDPNLPGNQTFTTAVIAPDTEPSYDGFQGTAFAGSFDGNGKQIRNLRIDTAGAENDYLGLFGRIGNYGSEAQVKNLSITNTVITGGIDSEYLGGICGYNYYGTISQCYAGGSIDGYDVLGGLCGYNYYGSISNCYSSGSIDGYNVLGGLCGLNDNGTINSCYATGSMSGNETLGGLCGQNYDSTISDCWASGSVSGKDTLGGLCGANYGTFRNCYSVGQVTSGTGSYHLGGLCGANYGTFSNCYFYMFNGPDNNIGTDLEPEQMIEQDSFTGFDFAGNPNDGTQELWAITPGHCPKLSWQTDDGPLPPSYVPDTNLSGSGYADDPFQINSAADFTEFITNNQLNCGYYVLSCDINLSGQSFTTAVISRNFGGHLDGGGHRIANITIDTLGARTLYLGIFGEISGSISNLGIENISITGGTGSQYLGGLCGMNYYGTINDCYAIGQVTGGDYSEEVGVLCGYNGYGTISNCYATGSVSGYHGLGVLCGDNRYGTISDCCATGQITGGVNSELLGGLCGCSSGTISNCYTTGSVSGYYFLGSLCGRNSGTISNCYATGPVNGAGGSKYLGGLCGYNDSGSTISNCYSTGPVTGSQYKGGFCGNNNGSVTGCFWDVNTSGMAASSGGTGLTTAQMKMQSTFSAAGWDFIDETLNGYNDNWRLCNEVMEYPKLAWQYLPGDIICPDGVDFFDLAELCRQWLVEEIPADLAPPPAGDGIVNFADFSVFAELWGTTNDFYDLLVFSQQWLKTGSQVCTADIATAPYGDGKVDEVDFALMAQNWLQ